MPEVTAASAAPADGTRKRSRSPSDSDLHKTHKRANTGAPTSSQTADESTRVHESSTSASGSVPTSRVAALNDVPMSDAPSNSADTAASTPTATAGAAATDDAKPDNTKSETGSSQTGAGQMVGSTAAGPTSASSTDGGPSTPSAMIHMRCLIVTQDASIIIGRGGKHVNEIREKSGARVIVSESIPGNPERILNVSGPLDAVSKVNTPSYSNASQSI